MSVKNEINMTEGRIMPKILQFTIPLILSGLLQMAFNAADNIVVGQFAGSNALAAVSSTGSITNFVINLFIGLSVGTNMILSNAVGAGNKKNLRRNRTYIHYSGSFAGSTRGYSCNCTLPMDNGTFKCSGHNKTSYCKIP